MKKRSDHILGFFIFIISFFWFKIFTSHLITFRFDHEPVLLYTKEYLLEHFTSYGGIAELFAQFISQFYINPWLGSLAVTLVVMTLVYRSFSISRNSAAPGILLWILSLALFSFSKGALVHIIALNMVLSAIDDQEVLKKNSKGLWWRRFITLPILILTAGSWAWLYVLVIVFRDAFGERQFSGKLHFFIGYAAVLGLIAQRLVWTMTINGMLFGTLPFDTIWGIAFFLTSFVVFLYDRIPKKENTVFDAFNAFAAVVILVAISIINLNDSERISERWRMFIKNERFENIIKEAKKKEPENRIQTLYVNYALAQEGRLMEDMFAFPQAYGPDGLLPNPHRGKTTRNINEFWFIGHFYYEIGYIDKAHRIAVDELVFSGVTPSYTKLMVKCLLADGHIVAAKKYLTLLNHTLFHRKWAKTYLTMLENPQVLKQAFSDVKKFEPKRTRIISYSPADNLLSVLEQQPLNPLAFNYLCAYSLLKKQPAFLVDNVWVLAELGYKELPKHYQEALMIYQLDHPDEKIDLEGMKVNQECVKAFYSFGAQFSNDKQPVLTNYSKTYKNMYLLYWFFTDFSRGEV